LSKYCTHCGQENADEAAFCIACGQSFGSQVQPAVQTTTQTPSPTGSRYTTEMGPGAHQHMLTDVYLKDSAGNVLLVARKQSLLHAEYTIVDGSEKTTGFIKEQTHLTHRTFSLEDVNHTLRLSVQSSNVSQNRRPPSTWLEDTSGVKIGTIEFTEGLGAFTVVRTDGSPIFEASMLGGSGLRQDLTAVDKRAYSVNLVDQGFSAPMLLAVITALS